MLNSKHIESFAHDGFTVVEDVFADQEIVGMRSAFDRLRGVAEELRSTCMHRGARFVIQRRGGRTRIQRIVWCGAVEPLLAKVGRDPRLLAIASQLLGSRRVTQLINQAHFKSPGDEVEFPWHQDSTHRRYGGGEWTDVNGRGSYVQTVTALDDVDESNGPILFLAGSGRIGHRYGATDLPGEHPQVAATMRAGSVLVFGPYVFHSSRPNRSSRQRRVLINGYAYPGANHREYPGAGLGRPLVAPHEPEERHPGPTDGC